MKYKKKRAKKKTGDQYANANKTDNTEQAHNKTVLGRFGLVMLWDQTN